MTEQVRLCAVWTTEIWAIWLGSSMNHIQSWWLSENAAVMLQNKNVWCRVSVYDPGNWVLFVMTACQKRNCGEKECENWKGKRIAVFGGGSQFEAADFEVGSRAFLMLTRSVAIGKSQPIKGIHFSCLLQALFEGHQMATTQAKTDFSWLNAFHSASFA